MKLVNQRLHATLAALRPTEFVRLLAHVGWPTMLGLFAAFGGLLMLGAAWHYNKQVNELTAAEAPFAADDVRKAGVPRQFARATEATFAVPQDSMQLDDLKYFFKLAKAKGINIDTVEYRQEQDPALQVLVRTMDVRVHEDYPKLKSFVAEILAAMPHAALQEIRVDRKDARTPQGQVLLKLAFVYRAEVPSRASRQRQDD